MAKATGSARSGTVKRAGTVTRKATADRRTTAADSPQRRKDPAFMKNLEAVIASEYAKSGGAAAAVKAPPAATPKAKPIPKARATTDQKTTTKTITKPALKASRSDGRTALADELVSLIPELDAEGLAFLIEQARVHLYNMRVAEVESAAAEADRASTRARNVSATKTGGKRSTAIAGGAAGSGDEFTIQAASDGSAYDLVYRGKWKMFTGDEMLAMVRIVSSKDPVGELGGRLYRWLLAERSDVIKDIPLAGLADPKLKKLVSLLRKTFTIKGTT